MTTEQEGAYFHLLMVAWGDGSSEPSLADDDRKLATWSRLGARWRRHGANIRAAFIARDGRLFSPWLTGIWTGQQSRHSKAVDRAKHAVQQREAKRGHKKRSRRHPGDDLGDNPEMISEMSPGHRGDIQLESELELEEIVERGPKGPSAQLLSAPTAALALSAARAAARDPETLGEQDAQNQAIDAVYLERLSHRAEEWRAECAEHAALWNQFIEVQRRLMGRPALSLEPIADGSLAERALYSGVVERVRVHMHWPSRDEWASEKRRRGELPEILGAA